MYIPMRTLSSVISLLMLTGCASCLISCASTLDRIETIGKQPPMSKVTDPTTRADYTPLTWPLPKSPPPSVRQANSLWQPGARAFFRDQRAGRVGDILRVNIKINDTAVMDNESERKRDASDSVTNNALFGLGALLPGKNPKQTNLLGATGLTDSKGTGTIRRQDQVQTQVAVLVTQVLPNRNLVVQGKQEVRINYDVREVSVEGVIRPEDINSDNTIDSTQIAEARIIYGGRGQMMDVQQPRWGTQLMDVVSPF
jgi:flagellar L-ring protein precursor FlgH